MLFKQMLAPPLEALPHNEAMEIDGMSDVDKSLDDVFVPNQDTEAYKRSTIYHSHPRLWLQLVEYNISPSEKVLEDLKTMFLIPRNKPLKDDVILNHELATMLLRNQKIRVEARKMKFIAKQIDKVVIPDTLPITKPKKNKNQKKEKIEYIKTNEPTPAPFTWESVDAK